MELQDIARIVAWLQAAGLRSLEIDGPRCGLRLEMPTPHGRVDADVPPPSVGVDSTAVGVFLDRHPCEEEPFARLGQAVRAGAIVGLVQVDVALRPVVAQRAGVVREVRVRPGAFVEFGTRVLDLEPVGVATAEQA